MVHLQEYTPPPARLCEGLVNAARQHVVRQPSDDMDAHVCVCMTLGGGRSGGRGGACMCGMDKGTCVCEC